MQDGCSALDVPPELPSILGLSVILALSVVMMLITYNDGLFKERPWVLCGLSAVMAFSIEVIVLKAIIIENSNFPRLSKWAFFNVLHCISFNIIRWFRFFISQFKTSQMCTYIIFFNIGV